MEKANKRSEARKFYTIACRMKASFQPRTSICKERDNNLIGNDRLIMRRWKQYFYATLNIKHVAQIREKVIYRGPEEQIEPPTNDGVREIKRTLKHHKSPGEDSISAELKYGTKNYGKKFMQ